jgi:tetratricopeptide (TPR) repeat protein
MPDSEEGVMSPELIAGFGGALLGAVVTGLVAWRLQLSQEASKGKEELRVVIMGLIDVREKHQREVAPLTDPRARTMVESFLMMKKNILLESADILVGQIPRLVSSSEYQILAYEQMLDSNFKAAEKFYLKAIGASRSDLSKIFALRALAAFYFGAGPQTDFGKGRSNFGKAVHVLPDKPLDPYSVYTLGYSYEMWAFSELANGFEEGRDLLNRARKYYRDLPDNFFLKLPALAALEARFQELTQGPTAMASPDPGIAAAPQTVRPPAAPVSPFSSSGGAPVDQ